MALTKFKFYSSLDFQTYLDSKIHVDRHILDKIVDIYKFKQNQEKSAM